MTGGTDKGDKLASTEILSMSISADILQFFFDPTSNQWVETGQLKKNVPIQSSVYLIPLDKAKKLCA